MQITNKQSGYMDGPEFVSRTLFNHAKKFYDSYKILENHEETNLPSLVCLALSIEIFLKSLRTRVIYTRVETFTEDSVKEEYRDKSILNGGHNLSILFGGLNEKMKSEISTLYKEQFDRSIDKDLSNISHGFVDWRYMYEGKTNIIHLGTAQAVGAFLFSYVNEKLDEEKSAKQP